MQNIIFWKLSSDFEVKCAQIFQASLFSTCEFGEPGVQYGLIFTVERNVLFLVQMKTKLHGQPVTL